MLRLHGAMSMCINIIIIQQNKKKLKKHQRQLLMDNHFLAALFSVRPFIVTELLVIERQGLHGAVIMAIAISRKLS